tara:strand:- start:829 stop:1401 length:573 start_codon:yes stop_codon:yes gene_type:complete
VADLDIFVGRITSTGFSSGDRIVIGDWRDSPLGSFTNVMWAKPDGTRILLSPSEEHAEYVSQLYNFERVEIVEIAVDRSRRGVTVKAGFLSVEISWGLPFPLPFWRPLWFIARIESLFARFLFGTRTHGRTKNNRSEWYSVRSISRVLSADASFDGDEMGESESFSTNACFGFSEPPSIPASVSLKTYIE